MMKNIIVVIALVLLVGCVHTPPKAPVAVLTSSRPDLQSFISKANAAAEQVLKEFNSSDSSQQLGGPFQLSDYESSVEDYDLPSFIRVKYELKKPVSFLGHPRHFEVLVYKDSGKTEVRKGR